MPVKRSLKITFRDPTKVIVEVSPVEKGMTVDILREVRDRIIEQVGLSEKLVRPKDKPSVVIDKFIADSYSLWPEIHRPMVLSALRHLKERLKNV